MTATVCAGKARKGPGLAGRRVEGFRWGAEPTFSVSPEKRLGVGQWREIKSGGVRGPQAGELRLDLTGNRKN